MGLGKTLQEGMGAGAGKIGFGMGVVPVGSKVRWTWLVTERNSE